MRHVAVTFCDNVEDRLEGVFLGIELANNGYDFVREVETDLGDLWIFADNKGSVPEDRTDYGYLMEIAEKGRTYTEVITLSDGEQVEVHVY